MTGCNFDCGGPVLVLVVLSCDSPKRIRQVIFTFHTCVCGPGCVDGHHGTHGVRAVSRVAEEPGTETVDSAATLTGVLNSACQTAASHDLGLVIAPVAKRTVSTVPTPAANVNVVPQTTDTAVRAVSRPSQHRYDKEMSIVVFSNNP